MVVEEKKKWGFTQVTSECDEKTVNAGDIVQYRFAYSNKGDYCKGGGYTLFSDLTVDEEELFAKIRSKTKMKLGVG